MGAGNGTRGSMQEKFLLLTAESSLLPLEYLCWCCNFSYTVFNNLFPNHTASFIKYILGIFKIG